MASEYNSKLISQLYNEPDDDAAAQICDEMVEIGDDVFVGPIFDAYTRFKNTSTSHYFIYDLAEFKSKLALEKLISIIDDSNRKEADLFWVFPGLKHHSYFDEHAAQIAYVMLKTRSEEILSGRKKEMSHDLEFFLEYIDSFKMLKPYFDFLKSMYLEKNYSRDDRIIVLHYLLKIDPSTFLKWLFSNFLLISEDDIAQIILVKELSTWKGENVALIKQKIEVEGCERAKEILGAEKKKEKAKTKKVQEEQGQIYINAQIVSEINLLREEINTISVSRPDIACELLGPAESLIRQTKRVTNRPELIERCVELRSILSLVCSQRHNLSQSEVVIHLGSENELKNESKPINRLFLYLISKKVLVDRGLYGIRKLNAGLSLVGAHPDEIKDLLVALDHIGCKSYYVNSDWAALHVEFLRLYKEALIKFKDSINIQALKAS